VGRDAFRVGQEEHRFFALIELHPLVFGRQESRTPEARVERLILVGVLHLLDVSNQCPKSRLIDSMIVFKIAIPGSVKSQFARFY
jgi:hypothetical protein